MIDFSYESDTVLPRLTCKKGCVVLVLGAVSPPLPPPPSSDVDDRFSLLQSRAFDPRYSAVAGVSMPYVEDYGRDGYAGRRSQIDEEEEAWMPENYLEKGWHWSDILFGLVVLCVSAMDEVTTE